MIRRPPRATRTDTLFPYTTLFRSSLDRAAEKFGVGEPDPLDLLPIGLGGGVPAAANDRRLQPIAALGIGIHFGRGNEADVGIVDERTLAIDRKSTRLNSSH